MLRTVRVLSGHLAVWSNDSQRRSWDLASLLQSNSSALGISAKSELAESRRFWVSNLISMGILNSNLMVTVVPDRMGCVELDSELGVSGGRVPVENERRQGVVMMSRF